MCNAQVENFDDIYLLSKIQFILTQFKKLRQTPNCLCNITNMIIQHQKSRYWLTNAGDYLRKFQRKNSYLRVHNKHSLSNMSGHNMSGDTINEKQKTFDEGQICQIPSSKDSPDKFKKFKIKQEILGQSVEDEDSSDRKNFKKDKYHIIMNNNEKFMSTQTVLQHLQSNQNNKTQKMQQNKANTQKLHLDNIPNNNSTNQKQSLSDLLIKQHLAKLLSTYQQDLAQLEQNKDNLLQAIEQIANKIHNLTEMQSKNQILQLENFKNKRQIIQLMKHYSELKINTMKKKLKMQQNLNKKKQKIRKLIQLFPDETQFVTESESWNHYIYQLEQNRYKNIADKPSQKQVLAVVFPQILKQKNKEKDTSQDKQKQKEKPKLVDKSGLLGDLKNFAKNFKIPNNQSDN